jgi:uncharacterized protein (DUF305 family)
MRIAAPGLALLVLTACDGGGDPVEQALRETATANQSAVVKETATVEPSSSSAETADRVRVAAMIAQHRAAVTTAEAALRESRDPEIRRIAQATIETRTREIAELEAWAGAQSVASR